MRRSNDNVLMKWQTEKTLWVRIGKTRLEGRCWGPEPGKAPSIILLHEGLGSAGLWKDFPGKLADRTGYGVFAYSRAGYGYSDPTSLPRPLDYMTREALDILPEVLEEIGFIRGVIIGHSDGASIATIYAGSVEDFRVRGVCLLAPHFFTEPQGLASIARAKVAYESGNLRDRMAVYHSDPDNAFYGWNNAWLDPGFASWNIEEAIPYLRVPVLVIQGSGDQYGTQAQIEALKDGIYSPLDIHILGDCKHVPHIEKPEETLDAICDHIARLDLIEAADLN